LTRQRLIRAALELFTTTGYHFTTTPLIARKAGVAEGTIYRHFDSKQHLLNELYRAAGRWAVRVVKEADGLKVGPREKLAELGRAPGEAAGVGLRRPGGRRGAPGATGCLSRSGPPTASPPPQREQLDLGRREDADRHADYADAATHVQLAVPALEVPHHVLRDQSPGGPPDSWHVELPAVDVPGERQRDAPWRSPIRSEER